MKTNLSLFIKPASSKCNLACKYCFYLDTAKNREICDYGIMSALTAEITIEKALNYVKDGFLNIAFQGGEPLVAGLSFFEHFVSTVNKKNTFGATISYSLQTNGVLITKEIANFFAENKFLIGVSLDGTEELHNLHRNYLNNKGSYKDVMAGISLLNEAKVDYNILTVLTKAVAKNIRNVYEFFKRQNFDFVQFVPCIDDFGSLRPENYSLSAKDYGDFLIKIYDLWKDDIENGKFVSVRHLDNIGSFLLGRGFESCDMRGICTCQFVIEADGSVFPCDFFVLDKYYLGNITSNSVEEILGSKVGEDFVEVSKHKPDECRACKYFQLWVDKQV